MGLFAKDLGRLAQITRVLGKYGFGELLRRNPDVDPEVRASPFESTADLEESSPSDDQNMTARENNDRTRLSVSSAPKLSVSSAPKRFRAMLEELGPTFIKFGQVLSTRPDWISQAFVDELKSLQDRCEPIPFSSIKDSIEESLGQKIEELFFKLEERPLGTASVAQVHRGITRSGEHVVVKVQRPGVVQRVRADIDVLYRIARFLDAVILESEVAEPVGIVREFERAFFEELDFRHEARNLNEFGALHKERKDVTIPTVYPILSSDKVLTMSFMDGVPLSRLPKEADKRAVALRILQEAFDEVFIDGLFHADPHPGNLMYLGPNRYAILDCGLLGRVTPKMRETLIILSLAVSMQDADTVARTLLRMGRPDHRISLADVRDDIALIFHKHRDRRLNDLDPNQLVQELMSLAMKHKLRIPAEYTMLARAAGTIEGIVRSFAPDLDVGAVLKPYAERLLSDYFLKGAPEQSLYRALLKVESMSQEFPIQLSQIFSDLSQGKFGVNVQGQALHSLNESIRTAGTTIAGAVLAGAFVLGSFIGLAKLDWQIFGVPLVGLVGAGIGLTVMFGLALYAFLRPRVKKVSIARWIGRNQNQ